VMKTVSVADRIFIFQNLKLQASVLDGCREAERLENRAKNRYRNVLPCMLMTCFLFALLCGRPTGRITRLARPSVCPFVPYRL